MNLQCSGLEFVSQFHKILFDLIIDGRITDEQVSQLAITEFHVFVKGS